MPIAPAVWAVEGGATVFSVCTSYILFSSVTNIDGDMLQKAWGFKIGEDSTDRISQQ